MNGSEPAADHTLWLNADTKSATAFSYCNLHGLWRGPLTDCSFLDLTDDEDRQSPQTSFTLAPAGVPPPTPGVEQLSGSNFQIDPNLKVACFTCSTFQPQPSGNHSLMMYLDETPPNLIDCLLRRPVSCEWRIRLNSPCP